MVRFFSLAALLLAGVLATPAEAAPAWCSRSRVTGFAPDCMYYTYGQCRAAVSGIGGDCVRNPFAYNGQPRRPPRGYYRY
jgi:hypothetical protein